MPAVVQHLVPLVLCLPPSALWGKGKAAAEGPGALTPAESGQRLTRLGRQGAAVGFWQLGGGIGGLLSAPFLFAQGNGSAELVCGPQIKSGLPAKEASRGVNLEWESLGGGCELTLSWAGWRGPGDVGKGREGGEDARWERQRVGRERLLRK